MLAQKRITYLHKLEIFVDNIIPYYNRTTWFSLHCYKLILGFYTCTACNLCRRHYCTLHSCNLIFVAFVKLDLSFLHLHNLNLYDGKVTSFTLHLHTQIFTALAKRDFSGLQFLLCVCIICYIYTSLRTPYVGGRIQLQSHSIYLQWIYHGL